MSIIDEPVAQLSTPEKILAIILLVAFAAVLIWYFLIPVVDYTNRMDAEIDSLKHSVLVETPQAPLEFTVVDKYAGRDYDLTYDVVMDTDNGTYYLSRQNAEQFLVGYHYQLVADVSYGNNLYNISMQDIRGVRGVTKW